MSAWLDFLEQHHKAKNELGFRKNEECFYRGHTSKTHKLTPGIFRGLKTQSSKISPKLWTAEYNMFFEFRARAKEVHGNALSDWDILFFMQHHGCRTRLLDWTENFGTALFFALLNADDKTSTPTIWLLNPYKLNEVYQGSNDLYSPEFIDIEDELSYSDRLINDKEFWWDMPIAIYPIRRVERLNSQGGYFTLHGNNILPLEDIVPAGEGIWRKLELPRKAIPDARIFLEMAGINMFTMFPDLDGLSRYLNSKYF
jgi:hypothetical protein